MIFFAIVFSIVSTVLMFRTVGGIPGQHISDFEPDYPGGAMGLGWITANVVVWLVAIINTSTASGFVF